MSIESKDHIIVFKVYNDHADAGFAQLKLREAGIKSFLEDEDVVGFNPLGGVELKIFAKDMEIVKQILKD